VPISVGIVGYRAAQHERVAALVTAVGGPVKAAALVGKTRTHIDNMRKPDAPLRLEDLLPLCVEAGYSLDWVATGHQVRPDILSADMGMVQIEALGNGAAPLAFDAAWLRTTLGIGSDGLRTAVAEDAGMSPMIGKGATVLVDIGRGALRSGVYLVGLDEELVARRLQRMPGGKLELVADHDPKWRYELHPGDPDVLTIHRIVWAGGPI
jgi:hypothetical protein